MSPPPFFGRPHRLLILLVAGMALALVVGARSSRSPVAQASDTAWAHCSAGTEIADPGDAHGLFVANANRDWTTMAEPDINSAIATYLPSDPTICGFTVVIPWSAIDKGPSASPQYDWSFLDNAATQWSENGKIVNLSVWGAKERSAVQILGVPPGTPATPQYVLDALASETPSQVIPSVSCPDGDPAGTPVYWDPNYENNWQAFQKALVAYVQSAPYSAAIGYIRFGIGSGDEDFPVDGYNAKNTAGTAPGPCWSAWETIPTTPLSAAQWWSYSKAEVDYEATLGTNHPLLVALNSFPPGLPFPKSTLTQRVADLVAQEAATDGMGIGMEGMSQELEANPPGSASCKADWCAPFAMYAGMVPLYMQEYAQSEPDGMCPKMAMVCVGALQPLLTYATRQAHAQVLELYPQEWLVADDPDWAPPTGSYATYHFSYTRALNGAACEIGESGPSPTCPPPPRPRPSPHPS